MASQQVGPAGLNHREGEQDSTSPGDGGAGEQVWVAITRILRLANRGEAPWALSGTAGEGLTRTETWLLGAVAEQGPLRATDLARWQGVDKSTITPQLRRLEDQGLVTRRSDPADRRAVLITISDLGRHVLDQINTAAGAVFTDLLRAWPAPERDALAALLTDFTEQLLDQPGS